MTEEKRKTTMLKFSAPALPPTNSNENLLAGKSTLTTVTFPVALLDKITEISSQWAISLGFPPKRNRNRWIVGVLKRAVDNGTNPLVEVSKEELARSIHLSTRGLISLWYKWEDLEANDRGVFYEMADKIMSQVNVYKKEKGE